MNLKKKLLLLTVAGLSTVTLYATSSFAQATGIITGVTVRMREKPTTSSEIIRNLDEDNKVDVLEKEGNWYKVSYKGDEGYVIEDYIKVTGEVGQTEKQEEEKQEENTQDETEQTSKEENTIETSTEETVASSVSQENPEILVDSVQKIQKDSKIYALPLLSSTSLMEGKKDTSVTVLQVLKNWAYVTCEGKNGWILKQNLVAVEENKPEETAKQEPTEETKPETTQETSTSTTKIGYVNVENANVREKPTTDSEHMDTLTLNDEVTILGEEDNWYKIKVGKKEGYIYKKLVSDEKVKQDTTSRALTTDRTANNNDEEQAEVVDESKNNESVEEEKTQTSATGAEIVAYAKQFLGCKYVSGGNGPSSFDCSGFTKYVFAHFGYSLSRTSGGQASNGTKVERSQLQQGDLLIFLDDAKSKVGHVGIYIGNNTFIHAANAKRGVTTDSLSSSYYDPRYVSARRII